MQCTNKKKNIYYTILTQLFFSTSISKLFNYYNWNFITKINLQNTKLKTTSSCLSLIGSHHEDHPLLSIPTARIIGMNDHAWH